MQLIDRVDHIILRYKISDEHELPIRIMYMFLYTVHKKIPNYSTCKIPKKDPRKSLLFKYALKAYNDTKGKILPEEYHLYVRAQIDILKYYNGLIDPACLAGERAWKRWLVWKKKYDLQTKSNNIVALKDTSRIKDALLDTKKVLKRKLNTLDRDKITTLDKNVILRWFAVGIVSGYYLLLSPNIDSSNIELSAYEEGITQELKDWFKQEFAYEF